MKAFDVSVRGSPPVVRIRAVGFWSGDALESHFDELEGAIARVRAAGGAVRVIVDLRDATTQSRPVLGVLRDRTSRLYQAGDRIAMVVSSALLGMQMRRIEGGADYAVFEDEAAASAWLTAA